MHELNAAAVAAVVSTLAVEYGEVTEFTPDRTGLLVVLGHGLGAGTAGTPLDPHVSMAGRAVDSGAPVVVSDLAEADDIVADNLIDEGIRSGVAAPIEGRNGVYGTLAAFSIVPREYNANEVLLVQGLASVLALASDRLALETALAGAVEDTKLQLLEHEQAERSIATSQARLLAAVSAMPGLIVRGNAAGEILEAHGAADGAFGDVEGLIGSCVDEILEQPLAQQVLQAVRTSLDTGEVQRVELPLPRGRFEVRLNRCAVDEVIAIVQALDEPGAQ